MPLSEFEFNIPTRRATTITHTILKNQNSQQNIIRETENITYTILSQNYFQFNNYYRHEEGLAMGAPSSAILAEKFF
jgi:hypothetical protein